jgi:transcription antitermination protein NusB
VSAPAAAPRSPARRARSVARLAAVQALYQMEVAGAGVEAVIREFRDHRFGEPVAGDAEFGLADADEPFFADLVRGVVARQGEIDAAVQKRLAANWKLPRLDATARALLRAGTFELISEDGAPVEVVIDEYVELAKAFFDGPTEPGFVNAALDGVARDVRN